MKNKIDNSDMTEYTIPLSPEAQIQLLNKLNETETECKQLQRKLTRLDRDNKVLQLKFENSEQIRDFNEKEREIQYFYNQLFLEACPDMIIVFDQDLTFVIGTHACSHKLGYGEDTILTGIPFKKIFSRKLTAESIDTSLQNCKHVMETKEPIHYSDKITSLDGTETYVHITLSPAIDRNGECRGAVLLLHDVTELTLTKEKAEVAASSKAMFLANMSHEIRTPMNAIIGINELLMMTELNEIQKGYTSNIANASTSLMRIINDVLDFSKIDVQKYEIVENAYAFAPLLEDIANTTFLKTTEKGLTFITDIDPNISAVLIGDDLRLKQVLNNMLSNSLKYTEKGFIKLSIHQIQKGEDAMLHFSIEDSGIGIKEEDIPFLFQPFTQMDAQKNKGIRGTGLGLSICRGLIKLMNGEIHIKSTYGKGSCFSFEVPQKIESHQKTAYVQNAASKNVFVIATGTALAICQDMLSNLGVSFDCYSNRKHLETLLSQKTYDFILFQYDSIDIIQEHKNLFQPDTKFVVIKDLHTAVQRNIDFETISLYEPLLITNLAKTLNGSATLQDDEIQAANHSKHKLKDLQLSAASILIVDDNEINLMIASEMVAHTGAKADVAAGGYEALEMVRKEHYDLIFMDHMMPDLDGVETTKLIREMGGEYLSLPIVALTANAFHESKDMLLQSGMNDFIGKPIDTKELHRVLNTWIFPKKD